MSESAKTITLLLAGGLALAVALLTRPGLPGVDPQEDIGKPLFADLDDPSAAARLEVLKFNEELAELSSFEVAKVDGVWSITSQENYPVEETDRLRDVATVAAGLKILSVATDSADEHKEFGVVEPVSGKVYVGDSGVGTLFVLKDEEGEDLARLIIGKRADEDEGGAAAGEKAYYVRRSGQDRVYTVKLDPGQLSTKFEDWIKPDLLGLSTFDVREVELDDYAIVDTRDGGKVVRPSSRLLLAVENNSWKLVKLEVFSGDKGLRAVPLKDDEELNKTTLDAMKRALGDLKIAGVKRKPASLIGDLQSGEVTEAKLTREGMTSLQRLGYFVQPPEKGKEKEPLKIYADSGEVRVGLNDGVEYLIRFGDTAGVGESDGDEAKKKDKKADGKKEKKDDIKLNRYVLVTARVNEDLLTKPVKKPLPKKPEPKKKEEKKDKKKDAKGKKEKKDNDSAKKKGKKDAPDPMKEYEAKKKQIEAENKRAQDAYDNKVKAAKKRVRELNARFAEWYFIVSEDVYEKVRVTRTEAIKKKPKKKEPKKKEPKKAGKK